MNNYLKPTISFQPLSLASGVSDGCNTIGTLDPNACPVEIPDWPGETVFTSLDCMWKPEDVDTGNICYHGPTGIVSVFGS